MTVEYDGVVKQTWRCRSTDLEEPISIMMLLMVAMCIFDASGPSMAMWILAGLDFMSSALSCICRLEMSRMLVLCKALRLDNWQRIQHL